MDYFRIATANLLSWATTIFSIQALKDGLQVLGLCASIAVSLTTLWWIKRQARSLDRKDQKE